MAVDIQLSNGGIGFADNSGIYNSPPIGFKNLQASATGLSATVTVTADEVSMADTTSFYRTARSVSLSINSAASGANGLDTGTIAASTWYSVWVISNGATTSGLLSLSATAPTMPSGYTFKARVGWIRTDGTANKYPLSFKQFGRRIQYVVAAGSNVTALPMIASGVQGNPATPTWVAASVANYVPTTAGKIAVVAIVGSSSATIVAPNNSYGPYTSTTNTPISPANTNPTWAEFVLESNSIYYAGNGGASGVQCLGWEDNL